MRKAGVIGGGAWGTALAQVAAHGGRETLLWALEDDVVSAVNRIHENPVYLKGQKLDPAIRATANFSDLAACDAWLVVTPAQHMRAVLGRSPCPNMPLILCSKGIEEGSGQLLHHVAREVCPTSPIAVLSGPTFAHEVAAGLPTAVTVATEDPALGETLRDRLGIPAFRIYLSDDVAGAEVGGAVKNVLAIACGIVEGKGLGQNARAGASSGSMSPRASRSAPAQAIIAALSVHSQPGGTEKSRPLLAARSLSAARMAPLAATPPATTRAGASLFSRARAVRSTRQSTTACWKDAAMSAG
jgi:glycerol-3-phosphate dehydrogenase